MTGFLECHTGPPPACPLSSDSICSTCTQKDTAVAEKKYEPFSVLFVMISFEFLSVHPLGNEINGDN